MSNRPGPRRVMVGRYEVPCGCKHAYGDHKRHGGHCKELDSYDCPCQCPSYEADENILADLQQDAL